MNRIEAVIIEALRTPVGRYGGVLRFVRPDDLGALVIKELVRRTGIDPAQIDDVLWGCANQAGEDNRNVGRMSALLAGLPSSVPAATINRLCGSSLDAVNQAARGIWSGDLETVIAGGVESMSRAPYSVPKNQAGSYGNLVAYDTALGWRYPNPQMEKLFPLESMGETAENVAERYGISRQEQDAFALESHRKAVAAQREGRFADEILPVAIPASQQNVTVRVLRYDELPQSAKLFEEDIRLLKDYRARFGKEPAAAAQDVRHIDGRPFVIVSKDEGPREDTSMEKLAALKPAFRANGTVTAGNSSSLNDGAAAVLITSAARAGALGLKPIARIVATGVAGVDPRFMGIGPVPAVRMALRKAGMTIDQVDLIELNEAFASQSLAVIRDLGIDTSKLNVNGGAIALGHPLGCSGARILTTLLHALRQRRARYGLATMCIGVGQGIATIVERLAD